MTIRMNNDLYIAVVEMPDHLDEPTETEYYEDEEYFQQVDYDESSYVFSPYDESDYGEYDDDESDDLCTPVTPTAAAAVDVSFLEHFFEFADGLQLPSTPQGGARRAIAGSPSNSENDSIKLARSRGIVPRHNHLEDEDDLPSLTSWHSDQDEDEDDDYYLFGDDDESLIIPLSGGTDIPSEIVAESTPTKRTTADEAVNSRRRRLTRQASSGAL